VFSLLLRRCSPGTGQFVQLMWPDRPHQL